MDTYTVSKNRMTDNVDLDRKTRYKSSYMDLHCLCKYLLWPLGLRINERNIIHTTDIFLRSLLSTTINKHAHG